MAVYLSGKCQNASNHLAHLGVLVDFQELNPRDAHQHFTVGIKGLDAEESNWVLDHLYKIATQPENIYRHQWKAGDVLVWDNRRTMHYAVRDYTEDMPRKLHRCTASGEIPV